MLLIQFALTFLQPQRGMHLFMTKRLIILLLIVIVLVIIEQMFYGSTSLNSALLPILVSGSSMKLIVYILHHKCQDNFNLSSWFSTTCAAITVQRNHFFCFY